MKQKRFFPLNTDGVLWRSEELPQTVKTTDVLVPFLSAYEEQMENQQTYKKIPLSFYSRKLQ